MTKVAVIVPAYNSAKYLRAAIESVVAQTFSDWQIVLVNDGSTDDTTEVLRPFRELLGKKFIYIYQENKGLPAARNTAIRGSSSELLALLDADDIWLPCRLDETVKMMDARPAAGLSYGLITAIDPEGNIGGTWEGNRRNAEGKIARQIYMRSVELPCPTISFRRECLEQVGPFDESLRATEDRDMWLRIALRYEVAFIPKVLAYYRVSPTSMSADPERMLRAQQQFIAKHYGSEGCGFVSRQIALARSYKQRAEMLKSKGRRGAALLSAITAIALYPLNLSNLRTAASLLLSFIK
jgi:glycosyltransferase involved in cell wall biosynthesis